MSTNRELVDAAWILLRQATITVAEWEKRVASGYYGQRHIDPLKETKTGQASELLRQVLDCPVIEPPPPPPPPPPATTRRFGIANGQGADTLEMSNDADLARYLDLFKANGIAAQRIPADFLTANVRRQVGACIARKIRPLIGIRPNGIGAMTPQAYGDLCRAFTEFGTSIDYELGNEPNLQGFYGATLDPAAWRLRINAGYDAIKAAVPGAKVITGGLSPAGPYGFVDAGRMNPLTWLERALQSGPMRFDVLGWHPYEWGAGLAYHPSSAWSQLIETPVNARSLLAQFGYGDRKIAATEYGSPSHDATWTTGGVSEARQAELIGQAVAKWRSWDWADDFFNYSGRDRPSLAGNREGHFGLIRAAWSEKPALASYRTAAA